MKELIVAIALWCGFPATDGFNVHSVISKQDMNTCQKKILDCQGTQRVHAKPECFKTEE